MKKIFENIPNWMVYILAIIIICYKPIILLIFFVFVVALIIYLIILNRIETKERRKFIKENNGKIFYIYSSKKRWIIYNKNIVLPMLDDSIGRIFNDKGKIKADFSLAIFYSFYGQLDKVKYPLFMKIVNDKAVGISIFDDLVQYNDKLINTQKFQDKIKHKIDELK